jgi:two-component system NtrC family sensor kinase
VSANRGLGVRAQILLGLTMVTLFAVLSTGYLTLWASGSSLRLQRESTVLALVRAAAAGASAAIGPAAAITSPEGRGRLRAVGRELTGKAEVSQICFLGPVGEVLWADPPRASEDRDPPVLRAVLGGVSPVLHYRSALDGSGTELLAYAPITVRTSVLGAVRVTVAAPPPTTVVLRRSGWVLLSLAAGNALLVLGLGYMVLTQLVVRPLQTVERATARVTAGDWEQAITPSGPREVVALAAAFNQMTASLASQREQLIRTEKLASVGQLAAGVAHEIGNPLAAILGFVDILRSDLSGATAPLLPPQP